MKVRGCFVYIVLLSLQKSYTRESFSYNTFYVLCIQNQSIR